MNPYSADLAQIRVNEFQREAERIAVVSRALRERKAINRERVVHSAPRLRRQAWVMVSSVVGLLRG
jgi:hypothetical protein